MAGHAAAASKAPPPSRLPGWQTGYQPSLAKTTAPDHAAAAAEAPPPSRLTGDQPSHGRARMWTPPWDTHHTAIKVYSNGEMVESIEASPATQLSLSSLGYGPYPELAGVQPLSGRTISEHNKMDVAEKKLDARTAIRAMQAKENADPVEHKCYQ